MNLILLDEPDFVGPTTVRVRGPRLQHVREVLGGRIGDELRVGRLNGRIGRGRVTMMREDELEMEVSLTDDPPPPLPVHLLLALPRPKSLRRILHTAAAMGVKEITLVKTWRVEKSFWQSPLLGESALRRELIVGLEQARDTVLPRIVLEKRFKPFVEDRLPDLARGRCALVAHPAAPSPFPSRVDQPSILAIGPEGGFVPYEVTMLERRGFRPVHVGPRILRVEDAVPVLLSRFAQPDSD